MISRSFELRELFHLVFLRQLAERLAGRSYAVKGGICLRFFHRSQRLSEDIDFDVGSRISVPTLQKTVDALLETRSLQSTLAPFGLTTLTVTKPKQTETVQRWKIGLIVGESRLPTKIEFSRRRPHIDFETGIPNREMLHHYKLMGFAAQFYGNTSMAIQKILALAAPNRSAARDLFDLHALLTSSETDMHRVATSVDALSLRAASDTIETFSYDDFAEQVIPYLTSDMISLYAHRAAFKQLASEVKNAIEGLQR